MALLKVQRLMTSSTDISLLHCNLGSVQFHSKFLPLNFCALAELLCSLTHFDVAWMWSKQEGHHFTKLIVLLFIGIILACFNLSVAIGITAMHPMLELELLCFIFIWMQLNDLLLMSQNVAFTT